MPIFPRMNITLPPNQEQWLSAQIAQGEFASASDAVARLITDRMILETTDLDWARPYVDAARAPEARKFDMSIEDANAEIDAHIASLTG